MENNTKNNSLKNYLFVFITAFVMSLAGMLPLIITGHGFFNVGGDYWAQMVPFNTYGAETVRTGTVGWDWLTGLGTDFIGSYSYYFFGSPFFFAMCLFPAKMIRYVMPYFTAFKTAVAAVSSYAYIKRYVKKNMFAALGAFLYAFSGYQLFNYVYFFFADVVAIFPLLLLSFDMLIHENKKVFFMVMTALAAFTNYFFFFGEVVFIIIYYIVKIVSKDIRFSRKMFLTIVLESVAGVCISAVILLPTVLFISSNSRVSGFICGVDAVSYFDNTIIPKIFQTLFIGPDTPSSPQMFISKRNDVNWSSVAVSIPIFAMVGVSAYCKNNKKSFISKMLLISLICALVPFLNSMFTMFNKTYYARWFYMPVLFMCLATVKSLDDDYDLNFGLKVQGAGLIVLLLISFIPAEKTNVLSGEVKIKLFGTLQNSRQFVQNMAFAALFMLLLYYYNKKKKENVRLGKIICVSVIMFVSIYEFIYLDYLKTDLIGINESSTAFMEKDYKICPDFDCKESFFRINNYCDGISYNNSLYLKYPAASSFHSVASSSAADFYEEVTGSPRNMSEEYDEKDYPVYSLLSVGYILNPSTNDDLNVEYKVARNIVGFPLYDKQGPYYIYKNENFVPVGSMFRYSISESRLEDFLNRKFIKDTDDETIKKIAEDEKYHYKQLIMLRALVLDDSIVSKYSEVLPPVPDEMLEDLDDDTYRADCSELASSVCSDFSYDEKGYRAVMDAEKDGIVFFSVPYSKGFSAVVNGKKVKIEKVDYGLSGIPVSKGNNTIEVSYETPGLKTGAVLSISGVSVMIVYLIINLVLSKKKKSKAETQQI